MWSMSIGGIGGLLFLYCFFIMYSDLAFIRDPIFERLHNFVVFVSQPAFYLIGDRISPVFIILDMLLFILYWAILGMGIACGLVWIYFSILRK